MRAAVCRAFGEPLVIEELELAAPGPARPGRRVEMSPEWLTRAEYRISRLE
jgi:hypothetical protein